MTSNFNPSGDVFQLTTGPDVFTVFPGQLANFPGGLAALAGDDLVRGSTSNELINGNEGNDTIYGGAGDDTLYGGQGNDQLFGEAGNDVLYGNKGLDRLFAGEGNNLLFGGQGQDVLVGGTGNDTLSGDKGEDFLIGGSGPNVFVLSSEGPGVNNRFGDFILNFDSRQDLIGLAGGLTAANLVFTPRTINIEATLSLLPVELDLAGLAAQGVFDLSSLFDASGTIRYTEISTNTGEVLATVINQTSASLSSRIISVDL